MSDRTGREKLIILSAVICFAAAFFLLLWIPLSKLRFFIDFFDMITEFMSRLQQIILSIKNRWLIAAAVLGIFLVKIFIPFPVSILFMTCGMVFDTPVALLINLSGMIMLFTVRYIMGKHGKGGTVIDLLYRSDTISGILSSNNQLAKGAALVVFRLVPSFPINTVSSVYGTMRFDGRAFLLLSVVGFIPKLFFYTVAGHQIFDPFSFKFTVPLILIFSISGFSLLGVNAALGAIGKKDFGKRKEDDDDIDW